MENLSLMSTLDTNSELPDQTPITIGEKKDKTVPINILRDVFEELTRNNAAIKESFTEYYKIDFQDIEQLHLKIMQTLEPHNVCTISLRFFIYYVDDTSDEITSFEMASKLRAHSTSQVERIYLKYDFMIRHPVDKKITMYSININIASQISLISRLKNEPILSLSSSFVRLARARMTFLKIEYGDYTIARSLQTTVKGWFSTLNKTKKNSIMNTLQNYISMIRKSISIIAMSIYFILCYFALPNKIFIDRNISPIKFIIIFSLLTFLMFNISSFLGRTIEMFLDSWTPLSFIRFNKKDEVEIENFEKQNRNNVFSAILLAIFGPFISVLFKFLFMLLFKKYM